MRVMKQSNVAVICKHLPLLRLSMERAAPDVQGDVSCGIEEFVSKGGR